MQFEIILLAIVIFLVANTYYDGRILDTLKSWSKYYQITFFIIGGLGLYLLIKNNPQYGKELFTSANQVVRCLPIDKNSKELLTPIFDFGSKNINFSNNLQTPAINQITPQQRRMLNSGKTGTKRSVSETKKKYIASQQDWKCKDCKCKLPAWFEVDHIIRLEYGGSNNVDNLVALCRNCHGKKTAFENL
tara:strand:+ start:1014 stop:1583 length:570 start_codon:yes stop_codon:yes gene_type:complete